MELRMTYLIGQSSKADHYDKVLYGYRSKSYKRILRPEQNPFCDPPFTKGVKYYHDEDTPQLMATCFRPYEFMTSAERIRTSEQEGWDPEQWDAINWRWRDHPPTEIPDSSLPRSVDVKQEALRQHLLDMDTLRRRMVVSDDKWERVRQQKDFEFREEEILHHKVLKGQGILQDTLLVT